MKKLFLDFETHSAVNIQQVGAWKYARHPSTDIMCMAVCEEGTPLRVLTHEELAYDWTVGRDYSGERILARAIGRNFSGVQLVAHSAHFEYAIWNYILHKRYGWPALWGAEHWACTLSRAAMCNLPLALGAVAAALRLPQQKDFEGRRVMLRLAKPRATDPLTGEPIFWTPETAPEDFKKLYAYCGQDVVTEMALDKRLPELPPMERKIWELDLIINHRGMKADVPNARRAMDMAATTTTELNGKLLKLTGGAVDKASRVAAIKKYLESQKVTGITSLDKQAVTELLKRTDPPLSPTVREVITIRQQVGKSSTAKYEAILQYADGTDGEDRMRGMLQYHAAGPGRWGGRGPQPQNFPQGRGYSAPEVVEDIESGAEWFALRYGQDKAMEALSAATRGVLRAGPEKTLISVDFSAIEARVLFWLADDQLALTKYRAGTNLYIDMAWTVYDNPKLTKKGNPKEYDVGKRIILGCGYGMGAPKFKDTCASYEVIISEELAQRCVKLYRAKYKPVVSMWYAQEAAARGAVKSPGSVHPCGKVVWGMDRAREFLVCKLPSGRHLRYYHPSVKVIDGPYGEKEEIHFWAEYVPLAAGVVMVPAGVDPKTGKMTYKPKIDPITGLAQYKTYGGSLVENITQATARDIMANGMLRAEAAGYEIVLTVHDEVVAEVDVEDGGKTVDGLIKEMCTLPAWAAGCPITAEGWRGERYRK